MCHTFLVFTQRIFCVCWETWLHHPQRSIPLGRTLQAGGADRGLSGLAAAFGWWWWSLSDVMPPTDTHVLLKSWIKWLSFCQVTCCWQGVWGSQRKRPSSYPSWRSTSREPWILRTCSLRNKSPVSSVSVTFKWTAWWIITWSLNWNA